MLDARKHIRLFVIALVVVSLSSIMPSAQVFTDPQVVACGSQSIPADIVTEIRVAASLTASLDLNEQINLEFSSMFGGGLFGSPLFTDPDSVSNAEINGLRQSINERITVLEQLATGPNRQCREIAGVTTFSDPVLYSLLNNVVRIELTSPLSQLYLYRSMTDAVGSLREKGLGTAVRFPEVLSQELISQAERIASSIAESESYEIALARASAVFLPIFFALTLEEDEELSLSVLNPALWKSLACGEHIVVPSFAIALDGGLVIETSEGPKYPFRQAGAELWAFTSTLLNILLILFNPVYGDAYYDVARVGCTTELRQNAANLYVALTDSVSNDINELENLVTNGESDELRWQAAARLTPLMANDAMKSEEDLQQIAMRSESPLARSIAGNALGLRWMRKVESGELDFMGTFEFPANGGINLTEGTLTQFAAAHAGAHPDVAQAVILPLFKAFRLVSERP